MFIDRFRLKNMHTKEFIDKVRMQFFQLGNYRKVARNLNLAPSSVKYIVENDYDKYKSKRGPKKIISNKENSLIRREVNRLKQQKEKVTSTKVLRNLNISCSPKTIQRELRTMNFIYKKNKKKIVLSFAHKEKRIKKAKEWLTNSHPWSKTIFTDEKKFNLDGPDSWCSWMQENEESDRNMRQMGGGSVMVWGMLLPFGYVRVFRMFGKIDSKAYVKFLQKNVLPVLKILFEPFDFIFQQDDASIHTGKIAIE